MKKEKIISFLIIFLSIFYLIIVLLSNKKNIFEKFNPDLYQKKYLESQWVIPQSKNQISDIDLYAYAGYKYVKGENPILINPEAPPLGKYIIGLSILLFQNFRILPIVLSFFSLVLIFLLTYKINYSILSASISFFLTAINTIFLDQIINAGQLEIFQLFFILLIILFFSYYLKNKKIINLLLTGIFFGCFISVKFFLYHFVLVNSWLVLFFLINYTNNKLKINKIIFIIFSLNLVAIITYIITYFRFFQLGGNFHNFLGSQKWIFLFYQQSKINSLKTIGSYLSLIFFNKWRYWSNNYPFIKYENWSFIWPIIFVSGCFSLFKLTNKNNNRPIKNIFIFDLLFSFFIIYNLFLFFTPIYPRYLLLLFFPLNIFLSIYISQLICKKKLV